MTRVGEATIHGSMRPAPWSLLREGRVPWAPLDASKLAGGGTPNLFFVRQSLGGLMTGGPSGGVLMPDEWDSAFRAACERPGGWRVALRLLRAVEEAGDTPTGEGP